MAGKKGIKNAQKFKADEVAKKANDYILNPKVYGDIVPTVEGLAVALGMSRENLYKMAEKNEIILHTMELLNTHQSKLLITGGLLNRFNAAITRLLLSRHGYIEKQQVEMEGQIQFNEEVKLGEKNRKLLEEFIKLRKTKI